MFFLEYIDQLYLFVIFKSRLFFSEWFPAGDPCWAAVRGADDGGRVYPGVLGSKGGGRIRLGTSLWPNCFNVQGLFNV